MAIVDLIGATTTRTGVKVERALDEPTCEQGREISDAEMAAPAVAGDALHPEWNDTTCGRAACPGTQEQMPGQSIGGITVCSFRFMQSNED